MGEVTRILSDIERGDGVAAERLLPLVYDELRRLAAHRMSQELPGQTLDATGLVHEAYLRLVDRECQQRFANRRHFFSAAAEAMRRILVDTARRKQRDKRGGGRRKLELNDEHLALECEDHEVMAVHECLEEFAQQDPETAELVKLHFFAGVTIDDAAKLLDISPRSAYRNWAYARAWLFRRLGGNCSDGT